MDYLTVQFNVIQIRLLNSTDIHDINTILENSFHKIQKIIVISYNRLPSPMSEINKYHLFIITHYRTQFNSTLFFNSLSLNSHFSSNYSNPNREVGRSKKTILWLHTKCSTMPVYLGNGRRRIFLTKTKCQKYKY